MNPQAFQNDWKKKNKEYLQGQQSLKNEPRQVGGNLQKTQKGQNTLQQEKGQKYKTFFSDSLKDALGVAKIKVTPDKCNPQFAQLMGLIESRSSTSQNKRNQIENNKKTITMISEQEIDNNTVHLANCEKRIASIRNSTFSIFSRGQKALQNKTVEIGNTENERRTHDQLVKEFERQSQQLNLNCFDVIQNQYDNINQKENGKPERINQQNSNQAQQIKNMYPQGASNSNNFQQNNRNASQNNNIDMKSFESFGDNSVEWLDRQQRFGAEPQQNQSKSYHINDINSFFISVEPEQVSQLYSLNQQIQDNFESFKLKMETEVKLILQEKRAYLDKLLSFSVNRMKEFFSKLPLDYFKKEGDKILKLFKLPAYEELLKSNMQSLPVKIEAFSISLSLEDLKRLQQDQLINDNLLEVYALYLRFCHQYLRSKQKQLGNVPEGDILIFSQLFFETQYDGLRIKQQEATAFINNIVPINDLFNPSIFNRFGFVINVDLHSIKHWIFFGVFNTTKEIICYDSAASNSAYFKSISEALKNFLFQIGGGNYTVKKLDNCPRQQNGTDCGMFVMKFIQNFAYGIEQKFTQEQVTVLRKKLHTFFPLLANQLDNNCLDFELLQFYEDTFSVKSETRCKEIDQSLRQL